MENKTKDLKNFKFNMLVSVDEVGEIKLTLKKHDKLKNCTLAEQQEIEKKMCLMLKDYFNNLV